MELVVLQRAVELARTFGETPGLVAALTALAEVELDDQHPLGARPALLEAREVVDTEAVMPHFVRRLERLEQRAGHPPDGHTRRIPVLVEELTDREQAVLTALAGEATQREIGASLHLSINTVKGYTKSLYRKLNVATRNEAVRQGHDLGLI